ncbi:MAG: hypothetical protein PUF50_07615 [Erysipelotrichaceae bacterium]|nr:hypothetical protein [Erysipelotrichaceae bacterium]
MPLLTLDEFFCGNAQEDSIAPNQGGFGRPSLAEIWDLFRKIELMPNVAWVRVALHDDTEIIEDHGTEVLSLSGESIVVCTDMKATELEEIANCEWLCLEQLK